MTFEVDIRDGITPALEALEQELTAEQLGPPIGAAVARLVQSHFLGLGTNKQGWPSTGFWARAARSTNFSMTAEGPLVSVNKIGVRQRFAGGEIKPVKGQYLTIPARAEAYGKRASEFNNLVAAFKNVGGKSVPWALVEASSQAVSFGKRRKDGSRKVTAGEEHGGAVMFWLVKSVKQEPDPDVMPSDEAIGNTAVTTASGVIDRALRRSGIAQHTRVGGRS